MVFNKSEILKEYSDVFSDGFFRNSAFEQINEEEVVLVGCKEGEKNGFIPEIGLSETQEGVFKILCKHKKGVNCSITEASCTQEFEVESI